MEIFEVNVKLKLTPVFTKTTPVIVLSVDGIEYFHGPLEETRLFDLDLLLTNRQHRILLNFTNKDYLEFNQYGKDMHVLIESCIFENYPKNLIHCSKYKPQYPEPWASEQKNLGIDLKEVLNSTNYLGWNGEWVFEFETPIYRWLHKTLNLGWLIE